MDLNYILLFSTALICAATVARLLTLRTRQVWPVIALCVLVIAVAAVVHLIAPRYAGFVAASLCVLLLLAPAYGALAVNRLIVRRRFGAARWVARGIWLLRPTRDFRELSGYVDALQRFQAGEVDPRVLSSAPATPLARSVYALTLRAQGRFAELLAFVESMPAEVRRIEAPLALYAVRALAELGEIERMLQAHAQIEASPTHAGVREMSRLTVLARLGRSAPLERLLAGPAGRALPEHAAEFWRATALQVSADPGAQRRLEVLCAFDPETEQAARRRLAAPLTKVTVAGLSAQGQAILGQIEHDIESSHGFADVAGRRMPATLALLASFALVFAVEVVGGSTVPLNLLELGALVIPAIPGFDQPWRLLSAVWLHLGAVHLLMNAAGLWVFGRAVESTLGPLRMIALFVLSALGGNLCALLVLPGPAILVGASGGVLGIFGTRVAIVAWRFRGKPTRFLRSELLGALFVIGAQVAFDLSVPAVSSAAHVAGFATGFVLGLLVAGDAQSQSK